ncbi:MAG: DUF2341 domain-containing protein [Candidatus Omnitrophica bacterium]|nr:DUF2341 domain-containing protein [Candidatus Omnitrophota bacterium]
MFNKILRIILAEALIFGQIGIFSDVKAATVTQSSWPAGSYSSKTSNISTGNNVSLLADTFTKTDTSSADFNGTLNNVEKNGATGLKLKIETKDAFTNLGDWSALHSLPQPGLYSAYVKLNEYVYCIFGESDGRYFGRYNIVNGKWEMLEPLPAAAGLGVSMATDGTKIFAIRGGGTFETYTYTLPNGEHPLGEWVLLAKLLAPAGWGASIVYVEQNQFNPTPKLFATIGGETIKFMKYDLSVGGTNWSTSTSLDLNVNYGGTLLYPQGSQYIYCTPGNANKSIYKFNLVDNSWGTGKTLPYQNNTFDNVISSYSGFYYPGRGKYIYVNSAYRTATLRGDGGYDYNVTNYRTFYRLDYTNSSADWEQLPELPADKSNYKAIMYYADTSNQSDSTGDAFFFSGYNYIKPWSFNTATGRWNTLCAPPYKTDSRNLNMFYPGFGDYIYYAPSGNQRKFYRYSLSNNKWENLASTPATVAESGNKMAYLRDNNTDYIYLFPGNSSNGFYRYAIGQTPGSDVWNTLANFPEAQRPNYSASDGIDPDIFYEEAGSCIVGVPASVGTPNMDIPYIYATRGTNWSTQWSSNSRTRDFYRFDTTNGWVNLAPASPPTTWPYFTPGTNLVYPGSGQYIYATNGDSYILYRYDITTNTWERLADSPVYLACYSGGNSLTYVDLGTKGKYIYAFSGHADEQHGFTWARYCLEAGSLGDIQGTWNELIKTSAGATPFSQYRMGLCHVATGDYKGLYTLPYPDPSFYKFDFDFVNSGDLFASAWSDPLMDYTPMGGYRTGNTAIDSQKNIYVCYGPYATNTLTDIIWVYSVAKGRWADIIRTPFKINGSKIEYVPSSTQGDLGTIYATGGRITNKLYKYNLNTKTWSLTANSCPETFALGTQIIYCPERKSLFFAGVGNFKTNRNKFYEFDTVSGNWSEIMTLPFTQNFYRSNVLTYGLNKDGLPRLFFVNPDKTDTNFFEMSMPNPTSNISSQSMISVDNEAVVANTGAVLFYSTSPDDGRYLYCIPRDPASYLMRYNFNEADTSKQWENIAKLPFNNTDSNGSAHSIVSATVDDGQGGTKEMLYVYNPQYDRFYCYSPNDNKWNEPQGIPELLSYRSAAIGYKGYVFVLNYTGSGTKLLRYNTETDIWDNLETPNFDLSNWSPVMTIAEFQGNAYIYVAQGVSSTGFYRYSIADNTWESKRSSPVSWSYGASLVWKDDSIYALPSGNTTVLKYNLINDSWQTLFSTTPDTIGWGASMVYPGSGNYIWVMRGANSPTIYKFDTTKDNLAGPAAWGEFALAPAVFYNNNSKLIYPGFGNYFYVLQGTNYNQDYSSSVVLRYDFVNNTWSEFSNLPVGIKAPGTLACPGGKYFYALRGQSRYDFLKLYAFSFGDYISSVKEIGKHADWGQFRWFTNGLQSISPSIRTSDKSNMSNATAWSKTIDLRQISAPQVVDGMTKYTANINSAASAKSKDKYVQYKFNFSSNNSTEVPILHKLELDYTRYPVAQQEITSNTYNLGSDNSRALKVNWGESLLPGTDVRFQLRSSTDGISWGEWKGPSLTSQIFNYDFTNVVDYAMDKNINLAPTGGAVITKPAFYWKNIQINNTGDELDSYQVRVNINSSLYNYWDYAQIKGDDIKFVDANGERLEYYIESFTYGGYRHPSNNAVIWVNMPTLPTGITNIKMYYGNKIIDAESNFSRTMDVHKDSANLIAYWDFEEGAGNTIIDVTGKNSGRLYNNSPWVTGKIGKALSFNGINQYVDCEGYGTILNRDWEDFDFNQSFSLEAWIQTSALYGTIARKYDSTKGFVFGVEQGRPALKMYDGTNIISSIGPNNINDGNMHHIALVITRDGSTNTGRFFVDGLPNGAAFNLVSGSNPLGDISNSTNFWLSADTAGNLCFNGIMDEVRLYDKALTQIEIQAHKEFHKYVSPNPTSTVDTNSNQISLFTSGWSYRQPIEISYSCLQDRKDWVGLVKMDLSSNPTFWQRVTNNQARPDGADLRFSDGYQELKYKVISFDSVNKTASFYLKIPYLLSFKNTQRIYLYYGNLSAASPNFSLNNFINATNLIGYWSFEDGQGNSTLVKDSSEDTLNNGKIYTGSTEGIVNGSWLPGKVGNCLNLNGINTYGSIPQADNFGSIVSPPNSEQNFNTDFTVDLWFLLKSNKPGVLIGKADYYNDLNGRYWGFFVRSAYGYLYFYLGCKDGTEYTISTTLPSLNTWHHLSVIYNGNTAQAFQRNSKMYLDGRLVNSRSGAKYALNTNAPLGLGFANGYTSGNTFGSSWGYLNGRLDEVRFYNRALTQEEVRSNYNFGTATDIIQSLTYMSEQDYSNVNYGYSTDNPCIQPVMGVYYNYDFNLNKGVKIDSFNPVKDIPSGTGDELEIKYQISRDGWQWYYWTGAAWQLATTGGYAQANLATEITPARLTVFQRDIAGFNSGDFYYRAFLHSRDGKATPRLASASVTLGGDLTFYTDQTGSTPVNPAYSKLPDYYTIINSAHTEAHNTRYLQYKAILYSDGQEKPVLNNLVIEYVNPYLTVNAVKLNSTGAAVSILNIGSTYDLTWNSDGINGATNTVKIQLHRLDKNDYYTIAENAPNNGLLTWTVPSDATTIPLILSEQSRIRITSNDFDHIVADSPTDLRVLSLKLTSPINGDIWEAGKENFILWDVYGLPPLPPGKEIHPLSIYYRYKNAQNVFSTWTFIGANLDAASGNKSWAIPATISNECQIKIFSPVDAGKYWDSVGATIIDTLNGSFAIVPAPNITVTLPQGLTAIRAGEPLVINWATNQKMFGPNVTLKYLKYNAAEETSYGDITPTPIPIGTVGPTPNSSTIGSYTWTVPLDAIPPRIDLPVRVQVIGTALSNRVAQNGARTIESNPCTGESIDFYVNKPTISISSPSPFITKWVKGDTNIIEWSTSGTISNYLKIDYSIDSTNGINGTWTTIDSDVSNVERKYTWTNIPLEAVGENVWLRITDEGENGSTTTLQGKPQTSVGPFEILNLPKLNIISPPDQTDGATLTMGKIYEIKWETFGNNFIKIGGTPGPDYSGKTYIYYSTAGENGPWTCPLAAIDNTGSTYLQIPTTQTFNAYIKVEIKDSPTSTPKVSGLSGKLSFGTPHIALQVPNGTETWYAHGTHNIVWRNIGAIKNDSLEFYYSTNGGAAGSWIKITNLNNGDIVKVDEVGYSQCTLPWQVPRDIVPEGQNSLQQVKLKIVDTSWLPEDVSDPSNSNFTITKPTITIVSPTTNDSWVVGTTGHPISWQTTGGAQKAIKKLVFEWRNRTNNEFTAIHNPITSSSILDTDQGSFDWMVPTDALPNDPDDQNDKATIRIYDPIADGGSGASKEINFRVGKPVLVFIKPNPDAASETLYMGDTYTIQWTTAGYIPDGVVLTYTDGTNWHNIDTGGPLNSEGSFDWTVGDTYSPGTAYIVIKRPIELPSIPTEYKRESKLFSILYPVITVSRIDGNQPWTVTETRTINWTSLGKLRGPFIVQWSKDNFITSQTINPPVPYDPGHPEYWGPTTTSINWTLPLEAQGLVKVRVNDIYWGLGAGTNYKVFGDTEQPFIVLPKPQLFIDSPNHVQRGTNCLRIGKQYPILWHDNGGVTHNDLRIQYSVNGGPYEDILNKDGSPVALHLSNTGTFLWDIQKNTIPSNNCKILITDNVKWKSDEPNAFGETSNEEIFEIGIPLINLTYPSGTGVYWAVGEKPTITWTTEGYINPDSIALQYTVDTSATPPDGSFTSIAFGLPNDNVAGMGSYTWAGPGGTGIPDLFSLLGRQGQPEIPIQLIAKDGLSNYGPLNLKVKSELKSVIILPKPALELIAPLGTEAKTEYEVGEILPIQWRTKGLSLNKVRLSYFESDTPAITYPIATIDCAPNQTNSFSWTIPNDVLISRKIRIKVTMIDQNNNERADITASSTNDIRFKGAFVITNLDTEAQKRKIVGKTETFTWTTKGSISQVIFEYFNGTSWDNTKTVTINNTGATAGQCNMTIPEPRSEHCRFKITNANDPTVFIESPEFKADYYHITWDVVDYDTHGHLDELGVKEDQTGWLVDITNINAVLLSSPQTRDYPAGNYITRWSKKGYIARAADWRADGDTIQTVLLENEISAQVEWHVLLSTSYNPATDTLRASTWLERRGKLMGPSDSDSDTIKQQILNDLKSATLEIYDNGTLVKTLSTTEPGMGSLYYRDNKGIFWFNWQATGLATGKHYFVKAIINYSAGQYTSGASIDISQAVEQAQQTSQLTSLQQSATTIETKVDDIADKVGKAKKSIEDKIDTQVASVKSDTSQILSTTTSTIVPAVQTIQKEVTTIKKSEILNRDNTIRSTKDLVIRFRSYTGVQPTIQVYDAENKLVLTGNMKPITSSSTSEVAIYEFPVLFDGGWGKGDFTIVCSEATYGTVDAMIISVIKADLEQIAGNVASVMGATSSISTLRDVADNLKTQFSLIETALSQLGKSLVKDVKDAAASANVLDSIYSQLKSVSKEIKQISGDAGVNLEKLYQVTAEKKNDIDYLKNKSQELKATLELNKKMVDNIANKPVTQTWYEYK